MKELSEHVDSLITIPNEKLLSVLGKSASLLTAFSAANDVLLGAVQGIAELITSPGIINVDFADVRTVMSEMGMAMMGTGGATGENRAREAAEKAIRSPLLEDIDLHGARGILVNITAGPDLSIGEFNDVGAPFRSLLLRMPPSWSVPPSIWKCRTSCVSPWWQRVSMVVHPRQPPPRVKLQPHALRPPITAPAAAACGMRQQAAKTADQEAAKARSDQRKAKDMDDYLDIPAFLRRQAD